LTEVILDGFRFTCSERGFERVDRCVVLGGLMVLRVHLLRVGGLGRGQPL
jgi:hypothetical protein